MFVFFPSSSGGSRRSWSVRRRGRPFSRSPSSGHPGALLPRVSRLCAQAEEDLGPPDPRSGSCPPCAGAQPRPDLPGSRADVLRQGWLAVRIQSLFGGDDRSTQNHVTVNEVRLPCKKSTRSVTHNGEQTDMESRKQRATGKGKFVRYFVTNS